jgi:hypothetical protein
MWKKVANILGYFHNFQKTAQRKQSPNRRKFAQSGHPAWSQSYDRVLQCQRCKNLQ